MPHHNEATSSRRRLIAGLIALLVCACAAAALYFTSRHAYYSKTVSFVDVAYLESGQAWVVGDIVDDEGRIKSGVIDMTSTAGASWTRQKSGSWAAGAITFADGETGWVATIGVDGSRSTILATSDGGRTWSEQARGLRFRLYDIACVDRRCCWAVGGTGFGQGVILATTDGGLSWQRQWSGDDEINAVTFADTRHGWAVGDGVVLATSDGGATWRRPELEDDALLYDVACADSENVWACGEGRRTGGVILHSGDGGATWRTQYSADSGSLDCLAFIDDKEGWVAGTRESACQVLHTSDGGRTYRSQETGVAAVPYGVAFADSQHGMLVGNVYADRELTVAHRGSVILATSDGGATWERKH